MQHGKESSQIEYPQKTKYPGLQKIPRFNQYPEKDQSLHFHAQPAFRLGSGASVPHDSSHNPNPKKENGSHDLNWTDPDMGNSKGWAQPRALRGMHSVQTLSLIHT